MHPRVWWRVAIAIYGLFWLCFAAFICFVAGRLPAGVEWAAGRPPWQAAVFDAGLIVLFGFQHSLMVRPAFKRRLRSRVPEYAERTVYVAVSVLLLITLMALWQPIGGRVWTVSAEPLRVALHALFLAGWGLIWLATVQLNHWHFFGLSQVRAALGEQPVRAPAFSEHGLYGRVRHPIHLGMVTGLWAAPDMTGDRLFLAGLMTVYVLAGLRLEERDLLRELRAVYADYRRRVPMLLPWRPRRPPAGDDHPGIHWGMETGEVRLPKGGVRILLLLCCLLAGAGIEQARSAAGPEAQPGRTTLQVDGRMRSHSLYLPADLPPGAPLVIALHGSRGDGQRLRGFIGRSLEPLADRDGFAIVYPDGWQGHWNDCRAAGPYRANTEDVDDPAYLRTLIAYLADHHGIDPRSVFALGFSNGGQMALRLALEEPGLVAGVAVLGAAMPAPDNMDCEPVAGGVPALVVNGMDDPVSPIDGGRVAAPGIGDRGVVLSSADTAAVLARRLDSSMEPVIITDDHGDSISQWYRRERQVVIHYALTESGHTIAQPHVVFPEWLGPTRTHPDVPALAWAFFKARLDTRERHEAAVDFYHGD